MLDLSSILNSTERVITFGEEYDLVPLSDEVVRGTANVVGTCTGYSGYIKLCADFKQKITVQCARCAELFDTTIDFSVEYPIAERLENEETDDYVVLVDGKLDLDELCESSIILNMPSRFLCRDDCKGLCGKCGVNLNKTTCGCSKKEIDPRLAKLKELL